MLSQIENGYRITGNHAATGREYRICDSYGRRVGVAAGFEEAIALAKTLRPGDVVEPPPEPEPEVIDVAELMHDVHEPLPEPEPEPTAKPEPPPNRETREGSVPPPPPPCNRGPGSPPSIPKPAARKPAKRKGAR